MTSTYLYHFITVITLYCKGPVITRLRDEGWTIALESTLFAVGTGIFLETLNSRCIRASRCLRTRAGCWISSTRVVQTKVRVWAEMNVKVEMMEFVS